VVTSLDRPVGEEGGETLGGLIPAEEEAGPFEELHVSLLGTALREATRALPELERQVIELRYLEEPPLTLFAAARKLGITREQVRQLEASALDRLSLERELQSLRETEDRDPVGARD
jgi:RNA polymerase primary sigma factor